MYHTNRNREERDGKNSTCCSTKHSNNGNDSGKINEMLHFLENLRIDKSTAVNYCNVMQENGFDDVPSLEDANEQDLKEIGIKIGHARRMKRAASMGNVPINHLDHNTNLIHYVNSFQGYPINHSQNVRLQRKSAESDESIWKYEIDDDFIKATKKPTKTKKLPKDDNLEKAIEIHTEYHGSRLLDCKPMESSVSDIDEAKIKIKLQADKIRVLESKIAKNTPSNLKSVKKSAKKILSPEERLQAHRKRKMLENKYKESSFKWKKPPPIEQVSLKRKVKRKDDFVGRLSASPSERRRQHEMKKVSDKFLKKCSQSESISRSSKESDLRAIQMMSDAGRKIMSATAQMSDKKLHDDPLSLSIINDFDTIQKKKKEALMNQLNFNHEKRPNHGNLNISQMQQCATCSSKNNCEEDVDNPGIYYCRRCWDEYDEICGQNPFVVPQSETLSSSSSFPTSVASAKYTFTPRSVTTPPHVYDQALWILHDNPQLGDKLLIRGRSMKCWIETKDTNKKNYMRILIGRIDYSGEVVNASLDGSSIIENSSIGTECIRLRDVVGYIISYDDIETRTSRDKSVIEFQLKKGDGICLTGENAQISTKEFFRNCNGHIDIILDPQCAPGDWYPFRETASMRKLAPQFRSKGVGYIRLGDDMSKNGLAFLSGDGCKTFFSSALAQSSLNSNENTLSTKKSRKSIIQTPDSTSQKSDDINRHRKSDADILNTNERRTSQANEYEEEDSFHEKEFDPKDILKQLEEGDISVPLKWDAKANLINRLGKAVSRASGIQHAGPALTALQDVLSSKNVNIFVLRNTVQSVTTIGYALGKELSFHAAWRTIFVEMLKMLKSKQVAAEVRKTLWNLHGRCHTLSNTMELIYQVLGLGQAGRPSVTKKGKKGLPTAIDANKKSANHVEIIEWLAVTLVKECEMKNIDPILDKDGLEMLSRFFMSHVGHRDQKCRKHVYDGIVYVTIYGMKHNHMRKDEAFTLCNELKNTNPRGWKMIVQQVNSIAEKFT